MKLRKIEARKWLLLCLTFLVAIIVGVYFLGISGNASPESLAQDLYVSCKINFEQCYAKEFATLSSKKDLPYVLKVLSSLQKLDPRSRGCHLIAHSISIAKTQKNPEEWREILSKMDIDMCSGGFVHGVLEAKSRYDEDFVINEKTIEDICLFVKEKFKGEGDFNCSHIMGHILLGESKGDIEGSIETCDKLSKSLRYECYSGVFMENETRENLITHSGFERIPWDDVNIRLQEEICARFDGEAARACWREIVHMYALVARSYPPLVYEACKKAPEEFFDNCYFHGLGIITSSDSFDDEDMEFLCEPFLSDNNKFKECLGWTIGSLMASSTEYVDRVVVLCESSGTDDYRAFCYNRLGEVISWRKDPDKQKEVCSGIPQGQQRACLNPKNTYDSSAHF